jgi:hypothetical protein
MNAQPTVKKQAKDFSKVLKILMGDKHRFVTFLDGSVGVETAQDAGVWDTNTYLILLDCAQLPYNLDDLED